MNAIVRTETVDLDRRRFVGTAAMFAAAAELGIVHPARASSDESFDKIRQVQAGPSTSAMPRRVRQTVVRSSCFMVGRTTSTAMPQSRRSSLRTGSG
jgi:hypothetical protein